MQLLKRHYGPVLVCLVLVVAGCTVWRVSMSQPFRFNHQKMLHQSIECLDCHTQAAKADKAGLPALDTCLDCHEAIDKKQPANRQVVNLFDADKQFKLAANVTAIPSDIIFSHKLHVTDKKIACAQCHKGIKDNTVVSKELRTDMKDCIACHAKTPTIADPNNCATCHQVLRKETKPVTHAQNWLRFHGAKAKDGNQQALNQCSLCHTESSCASCHQTQAPSSHTNFWRQRGHGVTASIDRDKCSTCHQSDTCTSCHKTTPPRSHRGQWGGPKDKHCMNCHLPVSSEKCSVCHQDGAPSHAKAQPTPATMVGTNCRACHGVSPAAKLTHADNGDDCTYCHR